jgi:penicillin-binding protein 1A
MARIALVALTVTVVGAVIAAMLSVSALFAAHSALDAAPELPDPGVDVSRIDDLEAELGRSASQSSVVLDSNGDVIGRFNPEEYHQPIETGEVPAVLETALLAAEDEKFRQHAGFDPVAIARAVVRNVTEGSVEQGGSTITQQLAKNLFTGNDESFERKLEELQVAIDLEQRFTKDEILTAYVNSVFLGEGAIGFEAASRAYFGKPASELHLGEAALLVGILPAPTSRNPRRHPDRAERARQRVLDQVRESGFASADEVREARRFQPEVLARPPAIERWPYYMDYVRRYLLDVHRMDPDLLYGGGLTIETALVPEQQYVGRLAVAKHAPAGTGLAGALAVVDVRTGLVTALVGGREFDSSQVNLALGPLGGGSGRQAGSSFKPFVLATALEQGYVPRQRIDAPRQYLPVTVDDPKPVHNFSGTGHGRVSLTEATVRSINTAYVGLTEIVGAVAVRDTATRMGIGGLPSQVGPSIGIGAYETSPLDMATAYAAFADDGRRVETGPVRRVLGPDGEVVVDMTPPPRPERPRVIGEQAARQVNAILVENVQRGTATRGDIGRPAAAKTGTSDDFANAWLVGHTPQFATAVWVGRPEGNVPMRDVAGLSRVTGGSIPAMIWGDVMSFVHANVPVAQFPPPAPAPRPQRSLTPPSAQS